MIRAFLNLCAVIFAIGLMSALSGCGAGSSIAAEADDSPTQSASR